MRKGWTYRKLGDICSSELGKTLNQSKDTGQLKPYLCSINVQWDHIDLSTVKQARFEDTDDERYSVTAGDLLVCEGGDIGRAAIWSSSESMLYQNALHRIRFNDSYLPRFYLHYLHFLKTNGTLDAQYGKGVTIKHLVKSSLMSIPVPVPPLAEQERIVTELDLLQGIIDKQKAQLKELDTLAQSIFYDMFGDPVENEKGWRKDSINSFASCVAGATPSTANSEYWDNGDIPWLSSGEVAQGRIYKTEKCITKSGYDHASTKMIPAHTVLIALAGQGKTRGTVGVAEIPLCTNQSICSILSDNTVDTDFLYYQLKMLYSELRGVSNGDGGRGGLNLRLVGGFNVVLPPLPIQQSFATKVKAIERQKASINASIAETQKLFDYTMDKYFG
ncbi:MAG: restriction endonuclease subunit S [Bacteroidales bacterium]|nr:restriction endonuclease subunit S [Bacteroidales bacterium]